MDASRKFHSTEALALAAGRCLKRYVEPSQLVLVGLSGGVDSVVLLHLLRQLGCQLAALHVHHGLQADADRWAEHCAQLCATWSVPFIIERVTVERDSADGLESAARRARHAVFSRSAADWIALGHQRGDRAETLLLNLLRGAGVRGAGAMRERDGRLLRPLLAVGRADILAYAHEHGLTWVEDGSNQQLTFARNFVRHTVLRTIAQRFPAVEQRLASAGARFAEACELLDELAKLDLAGHADAFPLAASVLTALPEPRARNVLRYLLQRHGVGISSEHRLGETLRQFRTAAADRHPVIGFGEWRLRRRGGRILLEKSAADA